MKTKRIIRIAFITVFILLIPFMAMQFTDEVDWKLFDFVVAGILIFGAGITFELVSAKMNNTFYRAAAALTVLTALILIWVNLAVGIIGMEDNPANLMYAGVLIVAVTGIVIARFRPKGMALALFVTALAQMLVGVISLIAGWGYSIVIDGLFAALWIGSALLFRHAWKS